MAINLKYNQFFTVKYVLSIIYWKLQPFTTTTLMLFSSSWNIPALAFSLCLKIQWACKKLGKRFLIRNFFTWLLLQKNVISAILSLSFSYSTSAVVYVVLGIWWSPYDESVSIYAWKKIEYTIGNSNID